jgi:hypothetical protein
MNHTLLNIFSSSGATAFADLPAREVFTALTIRIEEGTVLLGASTMSEGVTLGKPSATSPAQC